MRDEFVRGAFCAHLLGRLADHERFRLREVVGCEHFLVHVVLDRVVAFRR